MRNNDMVFYKGGVQLLTNLHHCDEVVISFSGPKIDQSRHQEDTVEVGPVSTASGPLGGRSFVVAWNLAICEDGVTATKGMRRLPLTFQPSSKIGAGGHHCGDAALLIHPLDIASAQALGTSVVGSEGLAVVVEEGTGLPTESTLHTLFALGCEGGNQEVPSSTSLRLLTEPPTQEGDGLWHDGGAYTAAAARSAVENGERVVRVGMRTLSAVVSSEELEEPKPMHKDGARPPAGGVTLSLRGEKLVHTRDTKGGTYSQTLSAKDSAKGFHAGDRLGLEDSFKVSPNTVTGFIAQTVVISLSEETEGSGPNVHVHTEYLTKNNATDSFLVGFSSLQTDGAIKVKTRSWFEKGQIPSEAKKGEGLELWGSFRGHQGVRPIPSGTEPLIREFTASWRAGEHEFHNPQYSVSGSGHTSFQSSSASESLLGGEVPTSFVTELLAQSEVKEEGVDGDGQEILRTTIQSVSRGIVWSREASRSEVCRTRL